jgi:serine/threonine protein kinase
VCSADFSLDIHSRQAPGGWLWTWVNIIICGIMLGMRYIHSRGFIHQDLKLPNIVVNAKEHSRIADLGRVGTHRQCRLIAACSSM